MCPLVSLHIATAFRSRQRRDLHKSCQVLSRDLITPRKGATHSCITLRHKLYCLIARVVYTCTLGFDLQTQKLELNYLVQHNKQHHRKVPLNTSHLNSHNSGFHPQTECTATLYRITNSTKCGKVLCSSFYLSGRNLPFHHQNQK